MPKGTATAMTSTGDDGTDPDVVDGVVDEP
jgi:hypothetical protein